MQHPSYNSAWLWIAAILLVVISCSLPVKPTPFLPTQTITPASLPAGTDAVTSSATAQEGPTSSPVRQARDLVIAYYASWSGSRGYAVAKIPADRLDVLVYAFINFTPAGECVSLNSGEDAANFNALKELKVQHPHLITLISIGGASLSTLFSDIAASAALRTAFARSCVAFMKQYGFNGIDVDWEFPVSGGESGVHHRPEDKQNFAALLAAVRTELDRQGATDKTHYRLTIAGGAGPGQIANLDLKAISPSLDWIDVMAYAFASENSPDTRFKSPLFASAADPSKNRLTYNANAALLDYLSGGVPANKLVLGTALYGQGWQGVPSRNNGLFQADGGPSQGTWAKDGVYSYQDLVANYLPTYLRTYDKEAQVPWLYNPKTGVFISYEDPQSLAAKAGYVLTNHLGGMAVWELSFDDDQNSLIDALYSGLHP
jgi:chitinase